MSCNRFCKLMHLNRSNLYYNIKVSMDGRGRYKGNIWIERSGEPSSRNGSTSTPQTRWTNFAVE